MYLAKCCINNSHLNSYWPKKQSFSMCPVFPTAWLQYFWKEATSATNWIGSKSCSYSSSQNGLVFPCLVIGNHLFSSSIINSAFSTLKNNSSSKVNESSKNPPASSSCQLWAPVLSLLPSEEQSLDQRTLQRFDAALTLSCALCTTVMPAFTRTEMRGRISLDIQICRKQVRLADHD